MKFKLLEDYNYKNEIVCEGRTTNDKFIILTKKSADHITMQHNFKSRIPGGSKFLKNYNTNQLCELFLELCNKITIKKDVFYGREINMGKNIGYFLIADKSDLETYKEYEPKWYDSQDPRNKGKKDIGESFISVPSLVFPKKYENELMNQFQTNIISLYTVLFNSEMSTLNIDHYNEPVYIMISFFPGGLKTRNGIMIPKAENWNENGIGVILFE